VCFGYTLPSTVLSNSKPIFDLQMNHAGPFWHIVLMMWRNSSRTLLIIEGIILKDLESKWEPGDRSGKWLKLKPDYIHAGADLDVIIIG
jgi:hypothetical protein